MSFKIKNRGILKTDKAIDIDTLIDELPKQHPVIADKHLDWIFLYAMYLGKQYAYPDYSTGKLADDSMLENTLAETIIARNTRSIYNIYQGFLKTYVAKMLKDDPTPQVYPTSHDNDMIKAARIGNIAIEDWWRKQQISKKLFDATKWSSMPGTGIMKVYFNKDAGVPISIGEETMNEGEIVCNSVIPWSFFPDPIARNIREARFAEEVYTQPISVLRQILGDEIADKLKSEQDVEDYKTLISSYTNETAQGSTKSGQLGEDMVLVKEYWERAIDGYDAGAGEGKGLLRLRAGSETIYTGPNPQGKDLPYHCFTANGRPEIFWGQGYADGIVQCQIDLNRVTSQTMENIDWLGNSKIAVPYSVEDTAFNKDAGELVKCDMSDGAPQQIQIQPFSPQVLQFAGMIEQKMMHIIGLHEVSFAQLPERASRISGRALDMLIESESVRFAEDIASLKAAIEDMTWHFIKLAREYYDVEKYVSIVGKYRGLEISCFKGEDLKTKRGEPGIFVEVGKGFGLSPARKAEQLTMLWDRGIIQDPQEVLKNLEFGTIGKIFYEATLDENKAQRRLDIIVSGVQGQDVAVAPPISRYDNHAIFIKVFKDFIRQPEYDIISEEQRKAIEGVLDECTRMLQEQMMQQQMIMQSRPQQPQQGEGMPSGAPMQQEQGMTDEGGF